MIEITRSALLPYNIEQIYDMVNAVDIYPSYLNGCVAAQIIEQTDTMMIAELTLAKAGIQKSFTTRNTLIRPNKIQMQLEQGPFESFEGIWCFTELAAKATKVSFELSFVVKGSIAAKGLSALMSSVGSDMVASMCSRAKQLYG